MGYNEVKLNKYRGVGRVKIPERVDYGGNSYRVISAGRESGESTDCDLTKIFFEGKTVTNVTIPETVRRFIRRRGGASAVKKCGAAAWGGEKIGLLT